MNDFLVEPLIDSNLFASGNDGYHTYRIPSLIRAANGDLLAFCEGRKESESDQAVIDLLMKRSSDNGLTWSDQQIIAAEEGMTCGNPCPVAVKDSGTLLMPFCKNPKGSRLPRTVWLTKSEDHGGTWSEPEEITGSVMKNTWTWYATGPGHGIQLTSGRIIIPCDHNVKVRGEEKQRSFSHLIYSDDRGAAWHIGAIMSLPGNECCSLELEDGSLYLNARTGKQYGVRTWALSRDCGLSFIEEGWHDDLIEPRLHGGGCQGSLIRLNEGTCSGPVLFCNPARNDEVRGTITLKASRDECGTWSKGKVIWEKLGAYSDMCLDNEGNVCVVHECGEEYYSERLRFVKINREMLL